MASISFRYSEVGLMINVVSINVPPNLTETVWSPLGIVLSNCESLAMVPVGLAPPMVMVRRFVAVFGSDVASGASFDTGRDSLVRVASVRAK